MEINDMDTLEFLNAHKTEDTVITSVSIFPFSS